MSRAAAEVGTTTIAVRELCEFTAKLGDLDLRFTPAPSAQEGIAGHRTVSDRRAAGYQREVALESRYQTLRLHGRADGLQPEPLTLEEIKTHRGDPERIPENHRALHWAQLKLYGAQLCRARALDGVDLSLVYFNVDTGKETRLTEMHTAETLERFHDAQACHFLQWAEKQQAHQQRRNAALSALSFPHPDFHAGQRVLAEAVYRTVSRQQTLLAQAPTGIGKSIGTLFPALKAMAQGRIDKIFYLTAKTSGRRMALDALAALRTESEKPPLRVLELVAREKSCEYPDKACHGESCPLAKGFYDRLPAAREAAAEQGWLDQISLRTVALKHAVCPYYLGQDLVRWSDVVVGDYNYYFDQSALLHGLSVLNDWRVAVLVDEAHNLVERGRAMYSAELDQRELVSLRKAVPTSIRKPLDKLNRAWKRMDETAASDYRVMPEPPKPVIEAMLKLVAAIGDFFLEQPATIAPELQRFYFDVLKFLSLAELFGDHSIFDISQAPKAGPGSILCIRNLVPAPFLAPRFKTASSSIAFSATFNPQHYYRDLLGLPEHTAWLDVPSPFSADQLEVLIEHRISTRYRDRSTSIAPIVELIAKQYGNQPGNYLAFFSSFEYLQQVATQLAQRHPGIPIWTQVSGMTETQRSEFLARFTAGGFGIGFAVLGGVFAEGIDLPGSRLIGAFIATLGLPQLNPVNEAMSRRMDALFGSGYDYTYLYPGLQKVVQAAGRVIRSREDRGVVYLIDDRFSRLNVRRLLPAWWGTGFAV